MSPMLTRPAAVLAVALAVTAAPAAAPAAAQPAEQTTKSASTKVAERRIAAYGSALAAVAATSGLTTAGRAARFLPVVHEYYDLAGSLAIIAGPAWTAATPPQRAAAEAALARNSAAQHAQNFKAPLTFALDGTRPAGADIRVRARIGAEPLVYRLRQTGSAWRIIDVTARGVGQLALQKSDLAATVAAGGVPALTAKLNELTARIR